MLSVVPRVKMISSALAAPMYSATRCRACSFVLHPLANEIRAGDNAEIAPFPAHQIHQRDAIQLHQIRQVEQRPQGTVDGGGRKLVQITQMTFRQNATYANGDAWGDFLRLKIAHDCLAALLDVPASTLVTERRAFLAQRVVKNV